MNSFWGQFNLINDTADGFAVSFDAGGGRPDVSNATGSMNKVYPLQRSHPSQAVQAVQRSHQTGAKGWDWSRYTVTDADGGGATTEPSDLDIPRYDSVVQNPTYSLPVSRLYHTLHTTTPGAPSPAATTVYCMKFDGGANPNPGPASSGAILYTPDRRPICERGVYHRRATNNMAEYGGLLLGLTIAKSVGARALIIEGDSQLVVRQMTGQYKVRDQDLLPNWRKAKELVREFDYVGIRHVYREDNTEADRITKDVLLRGESYERFYAAAADFKLSSR